MWGVVPAAGRGSRIQPLAFSKELLPVGSRSDKGMDRPCAVSEYLIERLILGGADKICFVISPGKSDILEYFGDRYNSAELAWSDFPIRFGFQKPR
jgi:glucose-1-phosphate thymidylyltransferase